MTNARGFSLIYVIAAMAALSAIVVAITSLTPSATLTEVQKNYHDQAYYAAYCGLNYAKSLTDSNLSAMNSSGETAYSLNPNLGFSLTVGQKNLTTGTYPVTAVGTVFSNGKKVANFLESTNVKPFSPSVRPNFDSGGISGQEVKVAGYVGGSVIADTAIISGGSTITGSLILTTTTQELKIASGVNVATDSNSTICSNYGINISNGSSVVNGNVYSPGTGASKGYVTLSGGAKINGNIYANGTVSLSGGSFVYGDVNSQKDITLTGGSGIGSSSVKGNSLSNLTPTFDGGGTCYTDINSQQGITFGCITITGNFHYNTIASNRSCLNWISGTEDHSPTAPTAPKPCEEYAQPSVPTFTATQPLHINGTMPPFTAGTYYYTYIDTTNWGTLYFDTSGGDINILVSGNVNISGNVYVKSKSTEAYQQISLTNSSVIAAAPYIYTYTGGSFKLGGGTNWVGTVLANGDIYPSSATIVGSLHSITGTVNPNQDWYNIKVVGLHN